MVDNTLVHQGKIELFFNDELIEPWNPVDSEFLVDSAKWEPAVFPLVEKVRKDGEEVDANYVVTVYVIKGRSEAEAEELRKSRMGMSWQGIYPYRENRVLQLPDWHDVVKFHPDLNVARVVVEFDHLLDEVIHTPTNKSKVQLPSTMREKIKQTIGAALLDVKKINKKAPPPVDADKQQKAHGYANSLIAKSKDYVKTPEMVAGEDGTVIVENGRNGPGSFTIGEVEPDALNKKRNIELIDTLRDGVLFEPLRRGANGIVVKLNKSHDFYQRVYMPLSANSLAIAGLDLLLFAMTNAELLTGNERVRLQFETMRLEMSTALRQYVAEVTPEGDPDGLDESEDA
jgi:hypothetical protein